MNAMHRKISTTSDRPSASDVAKLILACFPAAVLTALTFYPESTIPWLNSALGWLK